MVHAAGSVLVLLCTAYAFIEFCVGGSKELAVLYESYSTAAFVLQHSLICALQVKNIVIARTVCAVWVIKHSVEAPYNTWLPL